MSEEEKKGTEVVSWEAQLAAAANEAVAHEKPVGGKFIGTAAGVLKWDGEALPFNKLACIILDNVHENVFYDGPYDPDRRSSPTCYALGHNADDLAPHENVFAAGTEQNDTCEGCPQAEWGSARTGKGKACKNTRRLALIPAGSYDKKGELTLVEDEDELRQADIIYLRVPVMSVAGFSKYVTQVKSLHQRPTFGVVTTVSIVPDAKSQFRICFDTIAPVPSDLIPLMFKRHEEAKEAIEFPYSEYKEAAEEEAPSEKTVARSKKF